MAWIFSMWIEAEKVSEKKAIKEYFDGRVISVNNKQYEINAYEGGMVTVGGISLTGINSQQDADEMTAIGFEFYKLLKQSPDFLYALTGVEVDGYVMIEELKDDPEFYLKVKGFVIKQDLYSEIHAKKEMAYFKEGYWWTPYEGESYSG